jgi:membrane protease YdiL (CAAX protease family)
MTRHQQAATCYALALGLAVGVALLAPAGGDAVLLLTMLTPAAAVLLTIRFATARDSRAASRRELGLGRMGLATWPAAVALPTIVVAMSYGVTALVHPFDWTPAPHVVVHTLLGVPIVAVLVTLEEVCWRGYLLPRFDAGRWWGSAAAVGALHGVWHLPLILLTTAYVPAGSRWVVVPVFMALLSVAGIVYGWLRNVSGSLWPVVVAHTTFNQLLGVAVDASPAGDRDRVFAYLTGETGILTLLVTGAVAAVLVRAGSSRTGRPRSRDTDGTRTASITTGVAASVVLMTLGAGGGAVAAGLIGSDQIADGSIRSRDVRDQTLRLADLDPTTRDGLRGAIGPQGPAGSPGSPGSPGAAGPAGADGVAQVVGFVGPVASIAGNSGLYAFAGPTARVTTTEARPRVSGTASAGLGLLSGSPQFADTGMCWRADGGGTVTNFVGSGFTTQRFTADRAAYAASASAVLAAGSYDVGMCVRNNGPSTINNNAYVNGWVQVTK